MASFVVNFKIKTPAIWQRDYIGKKMTITKLIYNALRNNELKKLKNLEADSIYASIMNKKYSKWTDEDKMIINNKRKEYKLTRLDLIRDVKPIYKYYKSTYSSQMAQAVAKRLWAAFDKYFGGKSNQIHEMISSSSFESESNTNGVIFSNAKIRILKREFDIVMPNDNYIKEALEHDVSYVRVIRMIGKTKDHYYAQVVFKGIPPKKKRVKGVGDVGIDIGTSTVAISSSHKVYIDELAKDVNPLKKELSRLERKLERSRRMTNPDNYNENGTIISEKCKWYKSNHYKVLQRKKKYLSAKLQRCRKESHEKLANMVISLGDKFHIEKMEFKGLQKRAKETLVNENGKYKKKKRFGKSLNIHAPSTFVSILKRKLEYMNIELDIVDTTLVKASQYNHVTKEYKKKELNERRTIVGNNEIQRDLYSAYILMNTKNNIIDQDRCEKGFESFLKLHDEEIERLKNQKNISCIGY